MSSRIISEGNILLHFDTCCGMRLHRDTFVSSLEAIESAANFTAKNLFGKECRVELTDIYIEEGSWKTRATFALRCFEVICVFLGTPPGQKLYEKLTSKKAEPYIEQKRYPELIADATTAILGSPAKEIRIIFNNCIFTNASPEDVIKQKNAFYKNAQKDKNFKGLGFKSAHEFSINKSNINDYIDEQTEETITHVYKKLILISPVIDSNSQKQWVFASSDEKSTAYKMEDLSFQESTSEGKYAFKEGTEIVAKICIKETKGNIERSVLEVYSIDGKEIKPKPEDLKLNEPINVIHQPDFHQPDLFSF